MPKARKNAKLRAKRLYFDGEASAKVIAEIVEVSTRTVERWISQGQWAEQRALGGEGNELLAGCIKKVEPSFLTKVREGIESRRLEALKGECYLVALDLSGRVVMQIKADIDVAAVVAQRSDYVYSYSLYSFRLALMQALDELYERLAEDEDPDSDFLPFPDVS